MASFDGLSRKRPAEGQLLKVDDDTAESNVTTDEVGHRSMKPKLNPIHEISNNFGFGFQSYQNIDPFAKAIISSNPSESSTNSANKPLSALNIPSPKSPKFNPFSKPSPVHNPFMTIVDSKDDLWNTVARAHEDPCNPKDKEMEKEKEKQNDSVLSQTVQADLPERDLAAVCATEENRIYGKVYSMSSTLPITNGEEDEDCLIQVRAKLFKLKSRKALSTDSDAVCDSKAPARSTETSADWMEVGVGPVKILKSSSGFCRLVMRRESKVGGTGTKLLLNISLKGCVAVAKSGDKLFRLSCMYRCDDDEQLSLCVFLLRTKLIQESDQLFDCITLALKDANENLDKDANSHPDRKVSPDAAEIAGEASEYTEKPESSCSAE